MSSIKNILLQGIQEKSVTAKGWIRYLRKQSKQVFGHMYDGSTFEDLQLVFIRDELEPEIWKLVKSLDNGSGVEVSGIIVNSPAKGQKYELKVINIIMHGKCDMNTYPLIPKKGYTMDYLRQYQHLRFRTKVMQCIFRIRSTLDFATHSFFHTQGYVRLHTPLITNSDCEGAGETFEVSSLSRYKNSLKHELENNLSPKTEQEKKDHEAELEAKKFFFGQKAYLTVSGQLDGEAGACGMGKIYTFGPTFRAENSNTSRHLAEFWMVEPEMAFMDLKEVMKVAQIYIQTCIATILEKHRGDLEHLEKIQENPKLITSLESIRDNDFPQISYTDAICMLQEQIEKGVIEFEENNIQWGMDMASEHEKHLVKMFGTPIIVYNYPSEIKAFYMHENEPDAQGRHTVAAMDMLVPGIGELIGGSQREVRLDVLEKKMQHIGLDLEEYSNYLDLRRYGNVPHSGFGLGFERLVMLATGTRHIRDVVPFPRAVGLI